MKRILVFGFLLVSILVEGQQDYQWMVRDGKGRINLSYPNNNSISHTVYFSRIEQPKLAIPNKEFCNDFFIILANGNFYMNDWKNGCHVYRNNNPDIFNYFFSSTSQGPPQSSSNIKYAYLTNRYEDDDPPDSIEVSITHIPNYSISPILPIASQPNVTHGLFSNHNLVNGKDITFILPPLDDNCNFQLRYEDLNSDLIFRHSSFAGGGPYGSTPNGIVGSSSDDYFFNGNILPLQSTTNHQIINFRSMIDKELIGNDITFYIEPRPRPSEGCQLIDSFNITVSDKYHDPNYIELKCVWEDENEQMFGIYHVECFNDGPGPVPAVTLEANIPPGCTLEEILDWSVCCKVGCGKGDKKLEDLSTQLPGGGENVKVRFPVGLKGFEGEKSCKNTAWFEFKVKFPVGTNLLFDDLSATSPMSYFEKDPYHITSFYDHWTCYDQSDTTFLQYLNGAPFDSSLKCIQGREINNCDYICSSLTFCQKFKNLFCCCKKAPPPLDPQIIESGKN